MMIQRPAAKRAAARGFTLVELMVVAVIVAVLASVAIPLMGGGKKKAMATEAQAALGMARSCLRAMYAETRDYSRDPNGSQLSAGDPLTAIPGVSAGDLAGKFFRESDYSIQSISRDSYVLKCQGSTGETVGVTITLDQSGNLQTTGI
ncbi:MAG: prepilin-type N-terminal cleavage/methylation domain-containing protein [Kiritimatiellae bacterium]|nr:prepilin-type N-terminal cleavage/methylation domain-containing protein [Kiritimatiellia bacterium]